MNKQNKILLGLLAFVVACTIGYALFSESITINGTATAKGDWSITTTCTPGIASKLDGMSLNEGDGYSDDTCSVVGNDVTYSVNLKYPTAYRNFTVKIKNTGTISASINSDDIDMTKNELCAYKSDTNEKGDCIAEERMGLFDLFELVPVALEDSSEFVYNLDDESIPVHFFDEGSNSIILAPGESAYLLVVSSWDSKLGDPDGEAYFKTEFGVQIPVEQVKAD